MTTLSEAAAMAVCWLYRQESAPGKPGLPDAHSLREHVVRKHGLTCSYCGTSLEELIDAVSLWSMENDPKGPFKWL